jgi:hypothetical protein
MVAGEDRNRMSPVQSQEYRHAQYVSYMYGAVGLEIFEGLSIKTFLYYAGYPSSLTRHQKYASKKEEEKSVRISK